MAEPGPENQELRLLREAADFLQAQITLLRERILILEEKLKTSESTPPQSETPTTIPVEVIAPPPVIPVESVEELPEENLEPEDVERPEDPASELVAKINDSTPSQVETREGIEVAIGKTWLNRIGAIAVLAAMAFFVKYSVDQGWVSPELRVILGGAFGCVLLAIGEYSLWKKMRTFAGGVLGCGVGVLYIATWGAYNYYDLVGPTVGGFLYTVVTLVSVLVAVHGRLLPIAVIAIIGGYGTPIALDSGVDRQVALMSYVFFLNVGFLYSASLRRWDVIRVMAWLGTLVLFIDWFHAHYDHDAMWRTWFFAAVYYSVFHASAIIGLNRATFGSPRLPSAILYAGNIVFFTFTYWLWNPLATQWLGLFAVILGALQWLLAVFYCRADGVPLNARMALWLGGASMLALAAPLQFDRYLVCVSWTVQAVVTFWFCRRYEPTWLRIKAGGLLLAAIMHWFWFEQVDAQLGRRLFATANWHVSWALLLCVFAAMGCYASSAVLAVRRAISGVDHWLAWITTVGGSVLLAWLFADQWERHVATWWWVGLAVCWLALSVRYRSVGVIGVFIGLAAVAKFLTWDTTAAMAFGQWQLIKGIGANRAVMTGLLVASMMPIVKWAIDRLSAQAKSLIEADSLVPLISLFTAIIVTWTGTFEIARACAFEPWVRTHIGVFNHGTNVYITLFWTLSGVALLWVDGRGRNLLGGYALFLILLAAFKYAVLDTLGFAAGGEWETVRGICLNRGFVAGLMVAAACAVAARRILLIKWEHVVATRLAAGLGVLAAVVLTWTGSYEIARAFAVEPWIREALGTPRISQNVYISMFWGLISGAFWLIAGSQRHALARYARLLLVCAALKSMLLDTLGLARSGGWEAVSGICFNAVFISGLLTVIAGIFTCRRSNRRVEVGDIPGFTSQSQSLLIVLVTLLTLWIPTFEIVRVFEFEPLRLKFADTRLAMHVALSTLWSVHATCGLILGFARRIPVLRYFSLTLYLVTVVKVFLFDLSQLEMIHKVISFMVLGVLLLFASLLYQRLSFRPAQS